MSDTSFGDRLSVVFASLGHLCVGIDPHASVLDLWGLPDTAEGARSFGLSVVDGVSGVCGIVKPQVAFFERFGSKGFQALEYVITAARDRGILVIADAKRGDIDTSVAAYAQAWLSPGSPLESDALTLSPFQGVGSLRGPLENAEQAGKGVFVLAATSNPQARDVQLSMASTGPHMGLTVSRSILEDVQEFNRQQPHHSFGTAGVVLGATLNLTEFGIDTSTSSTPIVPVLAPGFGHQGAQIDQVRALYGALTPGVIVSESRGVLNAGPDSFVSSVRQRVEEIERAYA